MAEGEKSAPEGARDFKAPTTVDSSVKSRVENPIVAQIAAEREDMFRNDAEAYLAYWRPVLERELQGVPDAESQVQRLVDEAREGYKAQTPISEEYWQKVAEQALHAGKPPPMTRQELIEYQELEDQKYQARISLTPTRHLHGRLSPEEVRKREAQEEILRSPRYRELQERYILYKVMRPYGVVEPEKATGSIQHEIGRRRRDREGKGEYFLHDVK